MLQNLIDQASDLYFARNDKNNDDATAIEIMRDFRIFEATIERMVACGDLKPKIGLKLIAMAGEVA